MNKQAQHHKLHQTELFISYVLRYGVIVCACIIGIGLALKLFLSNGAVDADVLSKLLSGKWIPADHVSEIFGSANFFTELNPDKIVNVGVVFLIALPIVRVGMTIFLFLFERDWIYVGITILVFVTLISSLFLKIVI